ncbi:hypothetical protein [Microbispora sp. GKU 823]|uniref:hypothetical protein n=1 Tax=Microbispora sp. GKU 823 TaxID=1652100 RepID=UPI0009A26514|nr:hypothetical protein [Microbispora sp. GKU 823]OPG10600.1 hypothetical protein B1L11_23380 [Microbispora sp. GKU 823]
MEHPAQRDRDVLRRPRPLPPQAAGPGRTDLGDGVGGLPAALVPLVLAHRGVGHGLDQPGQGVGRLAQHRDDRAGAPPRPGQGEQDGRQQTAEQLQARVRQGSSGSGLAAVSSSVSAGVTPIGRTRPPIPARAEAIRTMSQLLPDSRIPSDVPTPTDSTTPSRYGVRTPEGFAMARAATSHAPRPTVAPPAG